MDAGVRTGVYFGLTSGVITTLGLMVGLNAGTHSVLAVVGGILVIAIADSLSDALGIHMSKESEENSDHREVWIATATTFITKFMTSLSFIVPVLLLPLDKAITISIIWGGVLLALLSYYLARTQDRRPLPIIGEHLLIATIVIIASHWTGKWIHYTFS